MGIANVYYTDLLFEGDTIYIDDNTVLMGTRPIQVKEPLSSVKGEEN